MRKAQILPLVLPIQRQVRYVPQDFSGEMCRPTPVKNGRKDKYLESSKQFHICQGSAVETLN